MTHMTIKFYCDAGRNVADSEVYVGENLIVMRSGLALVELVGSKLDSVSSL